MISIIQQTSLNNKKLLSKIRYFANKLADILKIQDKKISIIFVDNNFITNLNKQYFNKNKPTNVISFPFNEEDELGEIYISVNVAKKEAEEWGVSLFYEIFYLIIHGILHLLGYDHVTNEKDAEIMEKKEVELIETLNLKKWRER